MKRIKRTKTRKEDGTPEKRRDFLYDTIPDGMMTIEELFQIGKQRICLLKELSRLNISDKNDEKTFRSVCNKYMPIDSSLKAGIHAQEQRKRDHVSHLVTMLAFSQTPALANWFKESEIILFRFRYLNELLQEERIQMVEKYLSKDMGLKIQNETISLRFELAPELVARRELEIDNGMATIAVENALSIIVSRYAMIMDESLLKAKRKQETLDDKRVASLLADLQQIYEESLKEDLTDKKITTENIQEWADKFPPCMKRMHKALLQENHLKYFGRMQYGRFLKAIGMTLEESLQFWKKSFAPKYTEETFERQYAYNIRHNYGQEGKRTEYTLHTCVQAITANRPSALEKHGCPFRELSLRQIEEMLKEEKLTEESIFEITEKTKQGKYQTACSLLQARKRSTEQMSIVTPKDFFIAETAHAKENGKKQPRFAGERCNEGSVDW